MKCPLGISIFLKRSLVFPILLFSSISLHWSWGRLSYFSLPFFGTLHSDAYIFPFLLCFSLLFFSQLFVRPPQTAILLFCISFPWGWSWSLSPVQCHEPPSIVHQALYQTKLTVVAETSGETWQLLKHPAELCPNRRSEVLVTQSCLTLCNPMDCSPPGSSVHGDSPGKNTGVGCYALLQRIFPTQGLKLCLCGSCIGRWILYHCAAWEAQVL